QPRVLSRIGGRTDVRERQEIGVVGAVGGDAGAGGGDVPDAGGRAGRVSTEVRRRFKEDDRAVARAAHRQEAGYGESAGKTRVIAESGNCGIENRFTRWTRWSHDGVDTD